MTNNYRGIRPASLITVLEGDGTEEAPFTKVSYVIVMEQKCGTVRPVTIGMVAPLTEPI